MAMDTSALRFPKAKPRVLDAAAKARAEDAAWRACCRAVDARDKRICHVTGLSLSAGAVDPWRALERHHLAYRSRDTTRKTDPENVLTVSRAVHQLLHAGALQLRNPGGQPVRTVAGLNHVAWNRRLVPKGEEPCRIRKGLPVRVD